MTRGGLTDAKATGRNVSVNQGRKLDDQRRLETFVVLAVNDASRKLLAVVY